MLVQKYFDSITKQYLYETVADLRPLIRPLIARESSKIALLAKLCFANS